MTNRNDTISSEHAQALEHAASLVRQLAAQAQRETLHIRELHHRMANDLQLVASIVSHQLRSTSNEECAAFVRKVLARLKAIGRLHRNLMMTADLEFGSYLVELCADMTAVVARPGIEIRASTEAVILPPRIATPLALIAAELITNAVKHGLAADGTGSIYVTLKRPDARHCVLKVFDSGPGLDGHPAGPGYGLTVIGRLVTNIGGTIHFHTRPGAEVKVVVPLGD